MKILDYIVNEIVDSSLQVLEIGSYYQDLANSLYNNGINITASEIIDDAPIWQKSQPYKVYKLNYIDALKLKYWDIVIANNVIHHLHSPYHFIDLLIESCNQMIFSSCMVPPNKIVCEIPSNDYGSHSRRIILSPSRYTSYLGERGWAIKHFHTNLLDTKNRSSWLINAVKN